MNAHDLLELADDLLTESREVSWRAAASHAYYGAFHVGLEFLHRCSFHIPSNERAHAGVMLRLSNGGHAQIDAIGRRLDHLRRSRNSADYDLGAFFDHHTAADLVQTAHDVIETLDDALTMPQLLAQLTAAIQVYERDVLQQVTYRP
jgi:hypothetical protein